MKPRLLDTFCGAGGATKGYQRAGFYVVGVDIKPQPHYCGDEFYQADALEFLRRWMDEGGIWVDAIHASPPCQAYIRSGNVDKDKHPRLIEPVRELLEETGRPWVIENVPGAPMFPDAVLCGSMFGLRVRRHRWFETSMHRAIFPPASCDHSGPITGVYGNPHGAGGAYRGMLPGDLENWSREMGIDWMDVTEIRQAIPPAYTEFIGRQLLDYLHATHPEPPRRRLRTREGMFA